MLKLRGIGLLNFCFRCRRERAEPRLELLPEQLPLSHKLPLQFAFLAPLQFAFLAALQFAFRLEFAHTVSCMSLLICAPTSQ